MCLSSSVLLLVMSWASVARSQTADEIDRIIQRQNQITTLEQQRVDAERLKAEKKPIQRTPQLQSTIALLNQKEGACISIGNIVLKGAKTIEPNNLNVAIKPYEGECLTGIDIQNILRALTNYYIEKGFITSRAYLVPQNINQGILKILIVEGTVEDLVIDENARAHTGTIWVLGQRRKKILNIRDFEQGLDQINRLGSKDSTIRIEPGQNVGGSIVHIDVKDTYNIAISSGIDNEGSISTGQHQYETVATFEDIFGAFENLTISAKTSLDEIENDIYSRSFNGYFSLPLHYTTFNLSGNWSQYRSQLPTIAQTFSFSGDSWQGRAALDRVFYRDQRWIVSLGSGLSVKESNNYIEDLFIESSSQRLSIVELSAHINGQIFGGVVSGNVVYKRGLELFGAQNDDDEPADGPSAQFSQIELSASYQKIWQTPNGNTGLVVNGSFSTSQDTLFSSERVNLGGPSTIRGFQDQSISGDIGGYNRIEVNWTPKLDDWSNDVTRIIGKPQLFAALDAGFIADDDSDLAEGGRMSGGAVGVRLNGGYLSAEARWEQPFYSPEFLNASDDGFFRFGVKLNIKF